MTSPGLSLGVLPSPGDWIAGRYEIRAELGRGGHGVVFEAFDHELHRPIALKLLRESRASEAHVRRFRREAVLARDVQHPHLVRVFDLGLAGEQLFLIMEKVAGPTLAQYIDEAGRLAVDEIRTLAAQLLEALEALHRAGIVHRDVKPSNVLLETGSGETTAKLGDLGVARRLDPEETRATMDSRIIGTLAYLPPEIASGQEATERSDLYALGLTLLDGLVGIDFRDSGDALARALAFHFEAPSPETLRTQRPDLPKWFAEWLVRLLQPDPTQRYDSATSALEDLRSERSPAAGARRTRRMIGAALVLAASVATWISAERAEPRFHGLRPAPGGGVEAFDSEGRVLWEEPLADTGLIGQIPRFRLDRSGRTALAFVPYSDLRPVGMGGAAELRVVDPDDGRLVRRVPLDLKSGTDSAFSAFSRSYTPHGLTAVDLDDDGVDELVIVLDHVPAWPSIVLVYEPALDRARTVFLGSGHQAYLDAIDVDGDGRRDLLFSGYSDALRRVRTLTAVRLEPGVNEGGSADGTNFAVSAELGSSRNLLWQILVDPQGVARVQLDPSSGTLILHATDRVLGRRRLDGGDVLASPASAAREEALRTAYTHLREMQRLARLSAWELAAGEALTAKERARAAGDPLLAEVAARLEAMHRIRSGEIDRGLQQIEVLRQKSPEVSSIAYDAAEALHLAGRLDLAVDWYRRAALRGGEQYIGREKRDILLFLVLALVEQQSFSNVETEIRRLQAAYGWRDDHEIPGVLRTVTLQARAEPNVKTEPVPIPSIEQGRELYLLALEANRAAGIPAATVLADLDRALPLVSDSRGTFLALRSTLLAELGRDEEARAAAEEAARRINPEHDLLDYAFRNRNAERLADAGAL